MTQGLEPAAAEQWLFSKLNADATLTTALGGAGRIYTHKIPTGAAFPCIFITALDLRDFLKSGPVRIWSATLYCVRVVGQTASLSPLTTAAGRLDAVLHAASGSVAHGTVWGCVRERPFLLSEQDVGGKEYRHLGGVYRIWVS